MPPSENSDQPPTTTNSNGSAAAPTGGEVANKPAAMSMSDARCVGRCDVALGDITHHNVQQLRRLNQAVFPVAYNDKFYKEIVAVGELAKLAYFNDVVVGAVCCRIDSIDATRRLYIMTLGTLAPYRRLGIGTLLLNHVFSLCEKDKNIDNIYLHVQVNNASALDFYQRFGFAIVGTAEKYYKRIEPDSAYILMKKMN